MKVFVNAMGDPCPIPVVKTKNAIRDLQGAGEVEILVDNEIAVQNLTKMAGQKGYQVSSQKLEERKYQVTMVVGESQASTASQNTEEKTAEAIACIPDSRKNIVVAVSSSKMGEGDEVLGKMLMKSFIFALTQQDELPSTILFYNGGAFLTCEEAPTLEDLRSLEAQGVEILTCGTCLNHYGIADKLQVGTTTNMYVIAEKMIQASLVIKP